MSVMPQLRLCGSIQTAEIMKPSIAVSMNDDDSGAGFQVFQNI
jgi:hypothetical protein